MMRNLTLLLVFTLFFSHSLFAGEVAKVKGTGLLVNLQGDAATPGDQFFTLDAAGKKKGIIEITKVKGDRALAKIMKGTVEAGMSLQPKSASTPVAGTSGSPTRAKRSSMLKGRAYWGGMVGYGMDSMSAQVNDGVTNIPRAGKVALSGGGIGAMGMFDYQAFPQIWIRGLGGIEGFNVSGSAVCGVSNTEGCNANIYYLSLDVLGRYVFSEGTIRPWIGGGLGLLFPASKKSTALASDSIGTTNVIIAGGGADFFVNPTLYIPVSIEYGLLPKSNQVEASWIELRVGFAVPF